MMRRVAIVTAGAGVHRGNEHERARVFYRIVCTGDSNLPVFQRLTQDFKSGFAEFWQLVQEQHAVMGQGNLAGLCLRRAARHGNL